MSVTGMLREVVHQRAEQCGQLVLRLAAGNRRRRLVSALVTIGLIAAFAIAC